MEWIGLLDCNNFFVSCERLFRPDLKKKPVVVLSSNDGCVVARSQEIKDKGIPMGVPLFKVKDIIKDIDATIFSSHFALYRDISRRVFEVMRTELDIVEQYSVDEAFFVIEGSPEVLAVKMQTVKDTVERQVGIPVSIGVAASKTQAKYANAVAKKTTGTYLLTKELWQEAVKTLKVSDLWGVGYRLSEQYRKAGISTVEQLLSLERRQVDELFGVGGVRLWLELQGISTAPLSNKHESKKSILHSRSFRDTTNDILVLKDAVAYHVREAAEDLRSQHQKARNLQVSLLPSRHGDFLLQGGSAGVVLDQPTNDTFTLLKEAHKLVDQIFKPEVPYKKAGISLSGFTSETVAQLSMFADDSKTETSNLMPILDAINRKKGKGSVMLGSYLKMEKWDSLHQSKSPSYTTSWEDLAKVKA